MHFCLSPPFVVEHLRPPPSFCSDTPSSRRSWLALVVARLRSQRPFRFRNFSAIFPLTGCLHRSSVSCSVLQDRFASSPYQLLPRRTDTTECRHTPPFSTIVSPPIRSSYLHVTPMPPKVVSHHRSRLSSHQRRISVSRLRIGWQLTHLVYVESAVNLVGEKTPLERGVSLPFHFDCTRAVLPSGFLFRTIESVSGLVLWLSFRCCSAIAFCRRFRMPATLRLCQSELKRPAWLLGFERSNFWPVWPAGGSTSFPVLSAVPCGGRCGSYTNPEFKRPAQETVDQIFGQYAALLPRVSHRFCRRYRAGASDFEVMRIPGQNVLPYHANCSLSVAGHRFPFSVWFRGSQPIITSLFLNRHTRHTVPDHFLLNG